MIPEDIKQVDGANFAPMGNSYNLTWQNHAILLIVLNDRIYNIC